jgi:transposase InsO family protein
MSVARSTLRYESRLVKRDAPVVAVMRELAAQYPRYGYRRIQVFLARRGHRMSADRTHRLWRLNGLQVPRKRPRRRVASGRPRPLSPTGANQVWAYDFLFVSRAILRWVTEANIDTAYIDPGKPWQNGSNESFNGKFRDECLGMQWFKNRIDAKILIEEFRREFNEVRPHSSLGQLTPVEFKQQLLTTDPNTAVSKGV